MVSARLGSWTHGACGWIRVWEMRLEIEVRYGEMFVFVIFDLGHRSQDSLQQLRTLAQAEGESVTMFTLAKEIHRSVPCPSPFTP